MSLEEIQSLQNACLSGDEWTVKKILSQHNFDDYLASTSGYLLLCAMTKAFISSSERNLELILNYPIRVNDETKARGETPLHIAVERGNVKIIRKLLKRGANVNAKNSNLNTPLHIAVSKEETSVEDVIRLLLKKGADLKIYNLFGCTPYHVSTCSNKCILLEHEMNRFSDGDINEKDFSGYTLLHKAVETCDLFVIEFLLCRGANVNAKTKFKKTPLHLASQERNKEIALLLLNSGANVNATTDTGDTPLHLAAVHISHLDEGEYLELLLIYGADLKAKNHSGLYPVNYAVKNRSLLETKILLGENPDNCDPSLKMAFLLTFMLPYFEMLDTLLIHSDHMDRVKSFQQMTELFYSHGFRITPEDINKMPILEEFHSVGFNAEEMRVTPDYSKNKEHRAIVQNLLKKEETTCQEKLIRELLEYHVFVGAVKCGFVDIFCDFLPSLYDVNLPLIDDYTLLYHACEKGCLTIVKELLNLGANFNVDFCNEEHKSPLCVSIQKNNFECTRLLLENGANVNCLPPDIDGYERSVSPLYAASALKNNLRITKLLLHYGAEYRVSEMNALLRCPSILSTHSEIFDLAFDHSNDIKINILNYGNFFEEHDEMMEIKIGESNVTVCDVQSMSHRRLSILMRNDNFLNFLDTFDFETHFPKYARRIGVRVKKAKLEKQLIDLSYKVWCLCRVVNFTIPWLVFNEIVSYLDTEDLHRFIIASPLDLEMKKTVQFQCDE